MATARLCTALLIGITFLLGCQPVARFNVLAFYTSQQDAAHISFAQEANTWFAQQANIHHFDYHTTRDWHALTEPGLADYDVIIFLDSRPDDSLQRSAFQKYMTHGGSWMGFHFAGFALTPSAYPQNWDWYHHEFLGVGEYVSNTWRPTGAILKKESDHPATKHLPATFQAAPNEWYRWQHDIRLNPQIQILASIDSTSFPLGTGPKPNEIWHTGYYPVAWTNKNYRMIYLNMGHNDIDYEGANQTLSHSFSSPEQNKLILQALFWLADKNSAID